MKKYETYKDSGVEWIGEIPAGWDCVKTKFLFKVIAGATPDSSNVDFWDGDIAWVTPADYKSNDHYVAHGRRFITQKGYDSCATTIVPTGSIIFSKRAPIGSVALASNDLCTNQGCLSCVPNEKAYSPFYYYAMSVFTEAYNVYGSGTTFKEISSFDFSNFQLPLPSLLEQKAIVNYLDAKTSKIDTLVESINCQIEDLKKYRQSVISEAVTKGLNPNAEMKDSGVEWIGEIPAGWEVKKIKNVIDSHSGGVWGTEPQNNDSDIICVRIADFDDKNGIIATNKLTYRNFSQKDIETKTLSQTDLLLEKSGGGEKTPVGRVVRFNLTQKAICSNFIERLSVKHDTDRDFIYYYFYMMYSKKINCKHFKQTTGIQNLDISSYLDEVLILPSHEEQEYIAAHLHFKTSKIDTSIKTLETQVSDLQTLKQSIISEAVTGKVDVRDWKPSNN